MKMQMNSVKITKLIERSQHRHSFLVSPIMLWQKKKKKEKKTNTYNEEIIKFYLKKLKS